MVAVRTYQTVPKEYLQIMQAWRRETMSNNRVLEQAERILTTQTPSATPVGNQRWKLVGINGFIFALSMTLTFAYMPRILTKANPPIFLPTVHYDDDYFENLVGIQFAAFFSFITTLLCICTALNVWLASLPVDITNERLKQLTVQLKAICSIENHVNGTYKDVLRNMEGWFELRRQVFIGSQFEYRSLEALLVGDVLLVLMLVIGGLIYLIPGLIKYGDLGGPAGVMAFSFPSILLNLIWIGLLSVYVHSWGLIYTAGSEVKTQTMVIHNFSNKIQSLQVPASEVEVLQSYAYFPKMEERISVTDNDQPTIFGIKIQPTFKNVILSSGGTILISVLYAAFHQFF